MKKGVILWIALASVFFGGYASLAQEGNLITNTEILQNAQAESTLNKIGDWWATLGKSAQEKDKIVQERKENRTVNTTAQELQVCREKVQAESQDLKEKASQGIAAAKEKAGTLKEEAGRQAKEKAALDLEACKVKIKKEAENALNKANDFLKNWK